MIRDILKIALIAVLNPTSLTASYMFEGKIIEGYQEAGKICFPTANVKLPDQKLEKGVYACHVEHKGHIYDGMGSTDDYRPNIFEVHMFGFNEDEEGSIYGDLIKVTIKQKIRSQIDFSDVTLEVMANKFKEDASICRSILNNFRNPQSPINKKTPLE